MSRSTLFTISDTTPAAASTVLGDVVGGLEDYDWFTIDALLVGATGGALDVYLQRQVTTDVWADWLHFPQLAAGAAAVKYSVMSGADKSIVVVGSGTGAAATPALAANAFVGGHPGLKLRAVYVAGASTSAGAACTIYVTGWNSDA